MSEKNPSRENGRFSAKRKSEAVLRLLRSEDLKLLSREYEVLRPEPKAGIRSLTTSECFTIASVVILTWAISTRRISNTVGWLNSLSTKWGRISSVYRYEERL